MARTLSKEPKTKKSTLRHHPDKKVFAKTIKKSNGSKKITFKTPKAC